MSKKIAIAYGEIPPNSGPDEANMLALCADVAQVLSARGHQTSLLEVKLNLAETAKKISAEQPDVIFNLVDTIAGYSSLGHFAPQLFEHLKVPFTGGTTASIFLTTDKRLTKRWLEKHGIACPRDWKPGIEQGRFMVKSLTEDGSVGIGPENCLPAGEAIAALITEKTAKHGGEWFAEEYIDGREFNVAVLDGHVLPMAEIVFENYPEGKPKIIDYASKWVPESFEYNHTPRRFHTATPELAAELEAMSLACWELFGLKGYARVDFRVDAEGKPYVLEVNVNPCLDRDAGFAAAAAEAGISYEDLVEVIVTHVKT